MNETKLEETLSRATMTQLSQQCCHWISPRKTACHVTENQGPQQDPSSPTSPQGIARAAVPASWTLEVLQTDRPLRGGGVLQYVAGGGRFAAVNFQEPSLTQALTTAEMPSSCLHPTPFLGPPW